ncbi:ABC transporter substrate-binding protein [Roseiarcaceae bacterium H3SJ34-1]|uniref:ABC transporter substrate-binding protein n=1 Tax=Terripilifer ovatus TaxID=3032367 RepID=UPI003AB95F35|nr:ABC transporter substrate-binding protein [Roseiarcaceae bacterium H3SJ34-1]
MKIVFWQRAALSGLAVLGFVASLQTAAAQDKLKIAVGGQRGVGETFPPEMGQKAGIFKKHGLDLEVLYTEGTGETLQAVISGAAQVGIGTGFGGTLGPISKGAPVRIIGGSFTGGSQLYWYVKANSPIKSVKDAENHTVAYSTAGSSAYASVMALQKYSGVNFKMTATGSTPSTFAAVMSGQVDVGWAGAPFGLDALQKGDIRLVWKASAAPDMDKQTIRVIIARSDNLKANPDVYARFIRAYKETQDWVATTPEGLKAYTEWSGLSSEAAAKTALTEFLPPAAIDPYRIAGIDDVMDDAVRMKFLPERMSAAQIKEAIQIPAR